MIIRKKLRRVVVAFLSRRTDDLKWLSHTFEARALGIRYPQINIQYPAVIKFVKLPKSFLKKMNVWQYAVFGRYSWTLKLEQTLKTNNAFSDPTDALSELCFSYSHTLSNLQPFLSVVFWFMRDFIVSPLTEMELTADLLLVFALGKFSRYEIVINLTCALFIVDRSWTIVCFRKVSTSAQSEI